MGQNIFCITGAAGHLGLNLVYLLREQGEQVRALVLPEDRLAEKLPAEVEVVRGDVREKTSLEPLFRAEPGEKLIVIHAAGIVTIASKSNARVYDVNVKGTQNIVELCNAYGVSKLVYVSSVHAIEERPLGEVMSEVYNFEPARVKGAYAKTKAEATASVLQAAREGLDASVVHPSGLLGPYDYAGGHLTQLLIDYCKGRLTAIVRGAYDFTDVRDVAKGIIRCCRMGRRGEPYILSNRSIPLPELFEVFRRVTGHKPVRTVLPMWMAKATAGLSELYYKLLRQPPLYTAYSLYTLSGNALFSHQKADRELGYQTRPLEETVRDTYEWLKESGKV